MSDRILQLPPVVRPVPANQPRPLWSVMIPTFNCLAYLKQTLESVLVQDPGPGKMQIEVVDDCSNDGDVGALVQEIGKGRVGFFRQEQNRGHHRNFETCLNRSKGELIHLLHGDDLVLPGFYTELEGLFNEFPQIGAAFTKNGYINQSGDIDIPKKSLFSKPGIVNDFLTQIAQRQMLQVAAMAVRRSVYEKLGGFFGVNYCEDWEMWIRIAASFPVAYSPNCLALYRGGQGNAASITSISFMRGDNFLNVSKTIDIVQQYLPPEKRGYIKRMAQKNYSMHIAKASHTMYDHSPKVAFAQAKGALKMHQNLRTIYWVLKLYMLHFQKKISGKNRSRQSAPLNERKSVKNLLL